MQRFSRAVIVTLLAVSSLYGQVKNKPLLRVSCASDKHSYTANEAVNLTVTMENVGSSDFYIYRNVEWGWAGIGFKLLDAKGNVVRQKQHTVTLPPPPIYDKSQLVSLATGYFYGTHLAFDLTQFVTDSGVYFIEVSYQSNYRKDSGFGLPILTVADGEFVSNRVPIQIHSK
jgi:hypothetical protein